MILLVAILVFAAVLLALTLREAQVDQRPARIPVPVETRRRERR